MNWCIQEFHEKCLKVDSKQKKNICIMLHTETSMSLNHINLKKHEAEGYMYWYVEMNWITQAHFREILLKRYKENVEIVTHIL